ncbi:MAG: MarR family transcriptional regulator [Peptostreptococcales bacterium]
MNNSIFTDFISFRMGSISRDLARHFNSEFAEYGITIGQALVLFYLLDNNGSSLKDIAAAIDLDSPSVSRLVDRLLKSGYIIREEDETDRRSVQIYLTEKGEDLGEKIFPINDQFNNYLKQALGEENFKILGNCLDKIKNILN